MIPQTSISNNAKHYFKETMIEKVKSIIGVYALLALALVIFAIFSPGEFSFNHLLNIFRQAAPLGIVAIGQTLVLLVAGIDLSVGAVISLTNVVAAAMMAGNPENIFTTVIVTLLLSAFIGFLNGFTIIKLNIPPFLVTLAMSLVIQGAYLIYTKGSPKGKIAPEFRVISDGWIGFIPVAGLIWIAIWALIAFFLYKTIWGRKVYATGGNQATSLLSGIKVTRITISIYILSSLLAGVAGLMISAYIGVASGGVGNPYTLNSIAATVIGGTAFTGGRGGLAGTFAGVLIMVFLQSFMTMINVSAAGQFISQGVVIAVMVAINQRRLAKGR